MKYKNGNSWRNEAEYNHDIAMMWRDCRSNANMSLKDVEDCFEGVRVSYLSDFERGKLTPPLDLLVALFHAVGYSLTITAHPIEDTD